MKISNKIVIAALAFGSFTTNAVAQLYVGAHAGYAFSTAPSVLTTGDYSGTVNSNSTTSTPTTTVANIYGTSGPGVNVGLNAGYMLSEHFGIDLGVDYLIGNSVSLYSLSNQQTAFPGAIAKTVATITSQTTQVRVTPSLVVTAGKDGFAPYARFGAVLPVAGENVITADRKTDITGTLTQTQTEKSTTKVAGDFSVGFNSAIGANFAIGKITLFGELALTTLSIKAKTASLTAYEEVTTNALGTTTVALKDIADTYDKETVYKDQLTETSNNSAYNSSSKKDAAKEDLAPIANYNTLGINVGVKFAF